MIIQLAKDLAAEDKEGIVHKIEDLKYKTREVTSQEGKYIIAVGKGDIDVREVVLALREIEDQQGRDRTLPRFSHRPIDLDILTYDDLEIDEEGIQIPRHEILINAFVLRPLQDLAPHTLHPLAKKSYRELWQAMLPTAIHTEVYALPLD